MRVLGERFARLRVSPRARHRKTACIDGAATDGFAFAEHVLSDTLPYDDGCRYLPHPYLGRLLIGLSFNDETGYCDGAWCY
jgi:hypothetical protein